MADVETQEQEVQEEQEGTVNASGLVESKATKKIGDNTLECTVYLDLGRTAQEAITKFGDDLVFEYFVRSAKIRAQAEQRTLLEAGKTQEEIVAAFQGWRPGAERKRTPKDPAASVLANFASLSPEQQAAILEQLRAQMSGS